MEDWINFQMYQYTCKEQLEGHIEALKKVKSNKEIKDELEKFAFDFVKFLKANKEDDLK